MPSLLTDLRLTYEILPDYQDGADIAIDLALNHLQVRNQPYAFLVRRGIFA